VVGDAIDQAAFSQIVGAWVRNRLRRAGCGIISSGVDDLLLFVGIGILHIVVNIIVSFSALLDRLPGSLAWLQQTSQALVVCFTDILVATAGEERHQSYAEVFECFLVVLELGLFLLELTSLPIQLLHLAIELFHFLVGLSQVSVDATYSDSEIGHILPDIVATQRGDGAG